MPQMAPMNWLMLMIMFILIFMMFNSLNYFSFNYPIKKYQYKKSNSKLNWKW
uniref:ATP synthase complex subunit 8 n=1 Tax=Abraeinae sp. MJTNT-2012 TaxID=1227474 RepID=S4SV24_9COLE|nr:ATP synthase F0 subunit 8 [Abraeinae sp. MJTNT-2012]